MHVNVYLEHIWSRPRGKTQSRSTASEIQTSGTRRRNTAGGLNTVDRVYEGRRRRSPGSRGSVAGHSGRGAVARTAPTAAEFFLRRSFQTRLSAPPWSQWSALGHCSRLRTSLSDSTLPSLYSSVRHIPTWPAFQCIQYYSTVISQPAVKFDTQYDPSTISIPVAIILRIISYLSCVPTVAENTEIMLSFSLKCAHVAEMVTIIYLHNSLKL